jgi:multiple sugar transport system substrate-binding protein
MKTTRRLGALTAAALALATVAACQGSTADNASGTPTSGGSPVPELKPGQKVSITLESYNLSQPGPWTDTFKTLVAGFEKKYPDITVTAQKPGGTSANGVTNNVSSVQSEIATGNPPDVGQLTFGDMDFIVNRLKAKSLDALFGKAAVQANYAGTHPFAAAAKSLGDVAGSTYGVPFVFSTPVLYYNATLFQQAGLDPDKPPTTWDEFKADALAVKARTGKEGGYIDCLTKTAGDWCYQSLVGSNGGSVLSSDGKTLTYADPPGVQAVRMGQDLVTSGAMPKLQQVQAVGGFTQGGMSMMVESSSLQSTFQKGAQGKWDLRAAPLPSFAGQPVVPTNSGAALFMFSQTPAKQRASWDLIKYLTSDEAYTTIAQDIGYLPLRPALVDDPRTLGPWAAKNPLEQPNLAQLKEIKPWVAFPGDNYVQIRDGMLSAVESVVFQGTDAKSTLAKAAQAGQKLMPTG